MQVMNPEFIMASEARQSMNSNGMASRVADAPRNDASKFHGPHAVSVTRNRGLAMRTAQGSAS